MGHTLRTLVKWFHGSKRFNFTGSWSALYLIGDAARLGYFVPLNGHPPSLCYMFYEYLIAQEIVHVLEEEEEEEETLLDPKSANVQCITLS